MSDSGGVLRIEFAERLAPVFGGTVFGDVGAYECLTGTVFGALDPAHRLNAGIVNLDKAPRNARGLVEYESGFSLLKPVALERGNGFLLYDVPNRGNKIALVRLNRGADGNRPSTPEHAGDGFLMRQGFSVIWSAWQAEVPPGADRLSASFPIAVGENGPLTQISRDEFIAEGTGGPGDAFIQEISDRVFVATLSYPAATLEPAAASLTVRNREQDPRATPDGLSWRFVDARHIEITRPTAPGYDRGAIYEFVYRARDPLVMGIGFAAIRDLISFLRYGQRDSAGGENPLMVAGRNAVRHALGFGISQSGRVLRDFVHLGFNEDLAGKKVFDGIMPVVGGSRRTFINYAFAQPGRYARQHEDHFFLDDQFPFTYPTLTDPISGKTDGILRRAEAAGVVPKIIHLDTDSDLWVGRASLVVTDTRGADIAMPETVRVYMASGIQHAVHKPPLKDVTELPGNPLGYSSFMRALLMALVAWVERGVAPPASRFPSRGANTLVSRETVEKSFPAIPGVGFPQVLNELRLRDHSVEPPREGAAYPIFVSNVDADGNSLDGIRHPLLTVPLATHTGWALRVRGYAEGDLFTIQGSIAPIAATAAEREETGDPRRSIEERYPDRAAWAKAVAVATEQLLVDRLLLVEDADRLIGAARESWDVFSML